MNNRDQTPEQIRRTVERIVISRGAYGEAANARIDELLCRLTSLDAAAGKRWKSIMDLWPLLSTHPQDHYGVPPEGLPDTNRLCFAVPGYRLNPDGSMNEELIGRLKIARACAEKYADAYLLCTGGGTAKENKEATEAGVMAARLAECGIAKERIIIEDRSLTTVQNAVNSVRLLSCRYPFIETLALVTSDYHLATATLLFSACAILSSDPDRARPRVVPGAALKTSAEPLPALMLAGALLEAAGDRETAYEIYYGRYDPRDLPPI